ncbi:hypothetical protein JCM10049v2_005120 [Rhodotorula toruloides]
MLRIAVIGATGQQGSGVVSALLKTADYAVRAISPNPASAKAQALLDTHKQAAQAGRFALVHGDLTKPDTLRDALQGTYGVFFASPSIPAGQEDAQNSEEAKQGRGVVDAAKAAGCQHFVYSGLNSMKELQAVTILIPGGFYTNLDLPLWTRRDPDGTAVFCLPVKPDAQMQWVDERFDMGNFVTAVFKRGPRITGGKTYPVMDDVLTPVDMAKQYQTVTGEPAKFEPLAVEEYLDSVRTDPEMGGPEFAKEVEDWVHHINAIKPGTTCTGATFQDLGVKATTFDNWLERTGWRVGGTEDK